MSQQTHPSPQKKRRWSLVAGGFIIVIFSVLGMVTGKANVRSERVEGPHVRIACGLGIIVGLVALREGLKKREPIQPPENNARDVT